MQTRIERTSERYSFDSLHELGMWIERTPRKWRSDISRSLAPSDNWDLSAGYDEAVRMAQEGWLEGADHAQEVLKAFNPATPQPETKTDFYGFRPHVPRFCAGAPDNMVRHARPPLNGSKRVLTLVVPINAPWYTPAANMANYGIAVAQYVNQLEADDTRVEIMSAMSQNHGNTGARVSFSWTVKNADQPLDLAVIAFAIGHPAMMRRLGFALIERCSQPQVGNYMIPMHTKLSDLINPPPGLVILNGMKDANDHASTPAEALKYVTKQIDKSIQAQEL